MGEECCVQLSESEPPQLSVCLPPRPGASGQHDERPATIPGARVLAVDAPCRLGETRTSRARQAVLAAPSGTPRDEPAPAREAGDRSAHRTFGEAKGSGEANEATEGDRPSAWGDGIPKDSDQERAGAQWPLCL